MANSVDVPKWLNDKLRDFYFIFAERGRVKMRMTLKFNLMPCTWAKVLDENRILKKRIKRPFAFVISCYITTVRGPERVHVICQSLLSCGIHPLCAKRNNILFFWFRRRQMKRRKRRKRRKKKARAHRSSHFLLQITAQWLNCCLSLHSNWRRDGCRRNKGTRDTHTVMIFLPWPSWNQSVPSGICADTVRERVISYPPLFFS